MTCRYCDKKNYCISLYINNNNIICDNKINDVIYISKEYINSNGNDGSILYTIDEYIKKIKNKELDFEKGIGIFGDTIPHQEEAYPDIEYLENMKKFYRFVFWYNSRED